MSLTGVAKETLQIIESGSYLSPEGCVISIRAAVDQAAAGTVLYRPCDFPALPIESIPPVTDGDRPPQIEVTGETTAQAAQRLVTREGAARVVALNFASAKNAGGGFIRGAKAQEEDLARCSALYPCLLTQRAYYEENRAFPSLLYTDHIIYSPDVPFFRDERLELLATPFLLSLITAPAPNAGEVLSREPGAGARIREVLWERAAKVLSVAAHQRHRTLVLGAWGCGVFRNDPREVANTFFALLASPRFCRAFSRIVFAVYDRREGSPVLQAFKDRFS